MMTNWIIEKGPTGQYPQSIELAFKANEAFDSDAAANWFQRAMKSSDQHEAISGLIGAAALESKWGSHEKSIEMLMQAVNAGRLDAKVNIGKSMLEKGDLTKAEYYLTQANVSSAEDYVRGQALNALGCLALEREDLNLALNYFEQSAELGEELAKLNLADLAEEKGEINLARSWLWEIRDDLEAGAKYSSLTHYLMEELKKPWCFPEKLEERSRDFDVQVRRVVAGNKTTPRHVLERLQNDEDVSVKKVAQRTLNS